MSGPSPAVPHDTVVRQRRASHPGASAWVSANAGSGKTHVLTQRVVRLLLEGVPPARILCLTFTKAAAANMSNRVFATLAEWTGLDDRALSSAIEAMGAPPPSPMDLALARKLFARTVETPGGLKIQTIHAFCERLLHLFPFEANVAARFEVLDDLRQADLLAAARRDTLDRAVASPDLPLGRAVTFLAREASGPGFEALVTEALDHRDTLVTALALAGSVDGFGSGLGLALGLENGEDLAAVEHAMLNGGPERSGWAATAQRLGADATGKDTAGNRLARAALATGEGALEIYLDVFLTAKRTPRDAKYLVQALRKAEPALCATLDAERDRLHAMLGRRRAAETLKRTLALVTVAGAVLDGYETAKRRRGLLDFDDLVERTRVLLSRTSAAWVLFKLDAGIDHVLVDEAQDTSPAQWQILAALTGDFFSGAGQGRAVRTVFAVGDEKQSIFSFQGARPAEFAGQRRRIAQAARQGGATFEDVTLNLSFRSTAAVLDTVDRVFAAGDHARGVSEPGLTPPPHVALRRTPGLVELWPAIGPEPHPDPTDWRLPVDQLDPQSPAVTLARRVADRIAAFTAPDSVETVEDRASGTRRRIGPGDILILVRTRSSFFDAIIRALKDRQVPVAGADRLDLTDHIAAMDLIAAGRAALLPQDDLTVACVLKSPLIGLDDDDLIALAPDRRGSLVDALNASEAPRHRAAAATLAEWRTRAARETPFGFYARLLGPDNGRRAMLARLGQEAGDVVDEFLALTLAHERDGPPSLSAFLAELEGRSLSVKRDMDAAGDAVRVMTVHAAKGLEAKIVFLPDTCGAASGHHDPALFGLDAGQGPLLAWSPRKDDDATAVGAARQALRQAATEEHRRLLYVAMTRAEERLYMAGYHGSKGPGEGCWHAMLTASDLGLTEVPAPWNAAETILQRADPGLTATLQPAPISGPGPATLPAWISTKPASEVSYAPPLRPSNALEAADQASAEDNGVTVSSRTRARREQAALGRLGHHLLQHLPAVPPAARAAAALRYLSTHGTMLDEARRATLRRDVLGTLDDPALAPLFGPGSRAEVGIAGRVMLGDGRPLDITGQIDRIGLTATDVLIADFKTGRPHQPNEVPDAYLAQLALYRASVAPLYPDRTVRAFLVWTAGPTIVELDPPALDRALGELTASTDR